MSDKEQHNQSNTVIGSAKFLFDTWSNAGMESVAAVVLASGKKRSLIIDEMLADGFIGRPVSIFASSSENCRRVFRGSSSMLIEWKNIEAISLEAMPSDEDRLPLR